MTIEDLDPPSFQFGREREEREREERRERSFLPGVHILRWDGTGDDGTRLRDGVYFARLAVEDQVFSGKLVLMD